MGPACAAAMRVIERLEQEPLWLGRSVQCSTEDPPQWEASYSQSGVPAGFGPARKLTMLRSYGRISVCHG